MMLRTFLGMLLIAASSSSAWAQAISIADARNGGSAWSSSTAYGNARAVSTSTANGGVARSSQVSDGRFGGFADGRSTANTIGGYSNANGMSTATGPGSHATNSTVASSFYGRALASGVSMADPFGRAHTETVALSDFGNAVADGYTHAAYGVADGYVLSHSFGPVTYSRSMSRAVGMSGGPAYSDAASVAIGTYMPVQAYADAQAYAMPGAVVQAQANHFNDGYRY